MEQRVGSAPTTLIKRIVALALAALCDRAGAQLHALHAFTTSTYGPGDLHSWTDAVSSPYYGLDAADEICRARGKAAGLAAPELYTAWLSDRNNDAYCRVFGLNGKKSDNCGKTELPVGAGPWLRNDESPFAATIEEALDARRVYAPLNLDEFGNTFLAHAEAFTATDFEGRFDSASEANADCEQWTSAVLDPFGSFPSLGSSLGTSDAWTFNESGVSCNGTRRLMCLQRNAGASLNGGANFGRREAFVASAEVEGNLGGLAGADALCQGLAQRVGLYRPDAFKALLASASLGVGLVDRITNDGPWYRRDGLVFAQNKAELLSGSVTRPLNLTESNDYLGFDLALTGANNDGTSFVYDCDGWTSVDGVTSASRVNQIALPFTGGQDWADSSQVACAAAGPTDWPHHIYCLSDADVLFHDEFDLAPPHL